MQPSALHALLALLATPILSQTTHTATVLIPDWCVTQSAPTVTVLGTASDLTTYSYSCSIDSSAVSSASAKASSIAGAAQSRASALKASLSANPPGARTKDPNNNNNNNNPQTKRGLDLVGKRDNSCYGFDSFEACIPWEITQGPSIWAVHYTVTGIVALDQECSFGNGGVSSGAATCTASGRLDPSVWGNGDGPRTHTFQKNDVDMFWIRNTVSVTESGGAVVTTTGLASGSRSGNATVGASQTGQSGSVAAQSTALGVSFAVPTGVVAMVVGAGGVLVAALAL
jgi:hypothetical protein